MDGLHPKLQELQQRLEQASHQGQLALNATTIGNGGAPVIALFQETIGIDVLNLKSPITITPDEVNDKLIVTGTTSNELYLVGDMAARCTFGIALDEQFSLSATLAPSPSWEFCTSFPYLCETLFDDLEFTDPKFTLSTYSYFDAALQVQIVAGAGLFIRPSGMTGPLAPALQLLNPPVFTPSAFYGPLTYTNSSAKFHISTSFPAVQLSLVGFAAITMSSARITINCVHTATPEYTNPWIAVEGNVNLGGIVVPLAISLPWISAAWSLDLIPGTSVSAPNLANFLGIYTNSSLASIVPLTFPVTSAFSLTGLSGMFDIETKQLNSLNLLFNPTVSTPNWTIIPALVELTNLGLQLQVLPAKPNNGPLEFRASGTAMGTLQINSSMSVDVMISLPLFGGILRVTALPDLSLPSLNDLAKFIGNVQLRELLPASIGNISGFSLRSVELEINTITFSLSRFGFSLVTDEPWTIVDDHLVLRELSIGLAIISPLSKRIITGEITGTLMIGEVDVEVTVSRQEGIPDWFMQVAAESIPLPSLSDITKLTGPDLSDYFPSKLADMSFNLEDLSVEVNLSQKKITQIGFSLETAEPWEIIPGVLDVVTAGVNLNLSWQGSVRTVWIGIYGELKVVELGILVSAERSEDGVWLFRGEFAEGEQVSLGAMVEQLLNITPGLLPSLDIEGVAITFSPTTKAFSFEGRTAGFWTYEVSPALTLRMQASVSFERDDQGKLSGSITGDLRVNELGLAVTYEFNENSKTLIFKLDFRGVSLTAALISGKDAQGKDFSRLKFNFGDLTLGEILEYLVNLASPGIDFSLESPWDILNSINLKNLTVTIDLVTKKVSIDYAVNVNFGFIDISSIGLTYEKVKGKGRVKFGITGRFLGQEYGRNGKAPLEWDVVNDPPPSVPAKGPSLLDIRYLGLGQHVSFSDTSKINNVTDAINLFKRDMKPVEDSSENPLSTQNHSLMRFDRASTFLLGADLELMRTVSVSIIFNDPYLYGMLIKLAGARAKSLAGLKFELLYKRITDDIGVFKIELRVPDAFRQLEFGAVTITLPVIRLDIYTNGNFKVDMGFPRNWDFTDSFCVQIFPFIGYGGFYFAYLNGATSTRVPKIINGEFDPVIEFGVAMSIGVGKTFRAGPLSGGASVTLLGSLEGSVGWFSPSDASIGNALYYWIQGTAGLVGKLYGEIDFKIIQIGVSVEARAIATLVIEAYQPIQIGLMLDVEARASVKILFITISFTFRLSVSLQFTIGSRSTPPWTLDPAAPPVNRRLLSAASPQSGAPQLRMQRNHYRLRALASWMLPDIYSSPAIAQRATEEMPPLNWTPVQVFDGIQDIPLSMLPGFTVAVDENGGSEVENAVVLALYTRNSIDAAAREHDEVAIPTGGLSSHATEAADMPFNLLVRGMLAWSIQALMGAHSNITITTGDLRQLYRELERADIEDSGFTYDNLAAFIALNYNLRISGIPLNLKDAEPVPGTIFPMIPALSYRTSTLPLLSFATYNMVGEGYEASIRAYYEQLKVDFEADRAADPFSPDLPEERTCGGFDIETESMATVIFRDYFLMLAKAAVQSAIDLADRFRYPLRENDSLDSIAARFRSVEPTHMVQAGDSVSNLCDRCGITPQRLNWLNGRIVLDPLTPGETLDVEIAVTPETIARDNQDAPLAAGRALTLSRLLYQVKESESIASITARFGIGSALELFTGDAAANAASPLLLRAGSSMRIAQAGDVNDYSYFTYRSAAGDTLDLIAAWTLVRNRNSSSDPTLDWYAQTIQDMNHTTDFSGTIPAGTDLGVPATFGNSTNIIHYVSRTGDTLALVAGYFMAMQLQPFMVQPLAIAIQQLNPGIVWNSLPPGTDIKIPFQVHAIGNSDTLESLATLFLLTPADFMSPANIDATGLLAPLAVLRLPDVHYATVVGDTLGLVASRFNITVEELAGDVALVTGIFVYESAPDEPNYLTITNVPAFAVDDLLAEVIDQGAGNLAAGMVSRFLAHGMRLPSPDDHDFLALTCEQLGRGMATDTELHGIYSLTGQQFMLPDDTEFPYDILIEKDPLVTWIEFEESLIVHESDTPQSLRTRYPELDGRNPAIDLDTDLHTGLLLLAEGLEDLPLRITAEMVAEQAPSTTFDPQILAGPAALKLYNLSARKYTLPSNIHWQAAELPAIGGTGTAPKAGEPTIWPFTGELLGAVAMDAPEGPALGLFTTSDNNRPDDNPPQIDRYAWGTLVELRVRQISPTTGGNTALAATCDLTGADQTGRARLLDLLSYLKTPGVTDTVTLCLLYTPGAESNNGRGLASQKLSAHDTFILQTNLSTLTTSNALEGMVGAGESYTARLTDPTAFLELLWQASITGTGGYVLHYETADSSGLPNELFSDGTSGAFTLLVLLGSQSGNVPGRRVHGFNNCAVVVDNIDPAVTNVFAQAVAPSTVEMVKVASVPQGNIGFELTRNNPEYETPETAEQRTRLLYSLLGFGVTAGGGFNASHQGLPADPREPRGSAAEYLAGLSLGLPLSETWYYNQVFAVAPLAMQHPLPAVPGLPDPALDPYAGIAPNAQATIALAFHDVYGNNITDAPAPMTVQADIGYIDTVIGLGQWPGLSSSYLVSFNEEAGRAEIVVSAGLQAGNYFPATGNSFETAVLSASAHLERYRRIYYQIRQADVGISIRTSLNQNGENPPVIYPVEKTRLANLATAACVFLGTAVQQKATTYTTAPGDTLDSIAAARRGTIAEIDDLIAALGQSNKTMPTDQLFAPSPNPMVGVRIPEYHVVLFNDTLRTISEGNEAGLATNNSTVPMNPGVTIVAPLRTFTVAGPGDTFEFISTIMRCSVTGLAGANAARRGILMAGRPLTVDGVTLMVQENGNPLKSESLEDLAERFLQENVITDAASIALANARVEAIFAINAVLDVTEYVIAAGNTFASLATTYPQFTIPALASAAKESPNIFPAGTALFLRELAPRPLSATETLDSIATMMDIALDQLTLFNMTTPLLVGTKLAFPWSATINAGAPDALVPWYAPPAATLISAATTFGESTNTFAERNRNMPSVFVADINVAVGTATEQTRGNDSIGSLFQRLQQKDPVITFSQYLGVIAPMTGLVHLDALFIAPLPSSGPMASLNDLAAAFNAPAEAIGTVNSALAGFLRVGGTVSFAYEGFGAELTVEQDDTLAALAARLGKVLNTAVSVTDLARQNADRAGLVAQAARFLLPPRAVALTARFDQNYPSEPNLPGTIFRIVTELMIARDPALVADDFNDVPEVAQAVSQIAPEARAVTTEALSLRYFAEQFEKAFPTLKAATGQIETEDGTVSPREVWGVDFGEVGIRKVDIAGNDPTFFALRPIANTLINRQEIPIRTFDPAEGTLVPADDPERLNFQGIDMEVWATIFLEAVELFLSPEYAVTAYDLNPDWLSRIIDAKRVLAAKIATGVENVLAHTGPRAVLADARERMRQELLIDLSKAYAVNTIVQYPVSVESAFTGPEFTAANAPRFSGKPLNAVYVTRPNDTLYTVALYFNVAPIAVALLLRDTVRILNTGVDVKYTGGPVPHLHRIEATDTIESLRVLFGAADLEMLVDNLHAPEGLFLPETPINIYRVSGVAGATAPVPAAVTFTTLADYFNTSLGEIIPSIQERPDIFIPGLHMIGEYSVQITPQNNSIARLAAVFPIPVTPLELAGLARTTRGLIAPNFRADIIRLLPEGNLSSAKTVLVNGDTTLNILFNAKSPAERKKLFFDVEYVINELEFDISTVPGVQGYQASSWLSFIRPIRPAGASLPNVDTALGQAEIPVPLRAYPPVPLLVGQSGPPSFEKPLNVQEAIQWNYAFDYEHQDAAQDSIYLHVTFNAPEDTGLTASSLDDMFASLAQFVSAYPAVKSMLNGLTAPSYPVALTRTIQTFAEMVEKVAESWTYDISNYLQGPGLADHSLTTDDYDYSVGFTVVRREERDVLESLTLRLVPGPDGQMPPRPSPTGEFPAIFWQLDGEWKELIREGTDPIERTYRYEPEQPAAFTPLRHRIMFEKLGVLTVQNAVAGTHVERNQNLVSSGPTAAWFTYSTPSIRFPNLLTPLVEHSSVIPFGNGNLQQSLIKLFEMDLDLNTTSIFDVAVQFGYALVPSPAPEIDPIISRLPVAFQPWVSYAVEFPSRLYNVIQAWSQGKPLNPNTGIYVLDITVYSDLTAAENVPVLHLKELVHGQIG